jgi:hypothetical protein
LQAGRASWWLQQFHKVNNVMDSMFITSVLVTWGSSKTLVQMASLIGSCLEKLSLDDWQSLYKSVEDAVLLTQYSSDRVINFKVDLLPEALGARVVTLLCLRAKYQSKRNLYSKYLNKYADSDLIVLKLCQSLALDVIKNHQTNWRSVLEVIA